MSGSRLVDMYVDMRKEARECDDSTFTSPRMLLSVIRMATALARVRLADRYTLLSTRCPIRYEKDEKILIVKYCRSLQSVYG